MYKPASYLRQMETIRQVAASNFHTLVEWLIHRWDFQLIRLHWLFTTVNTLYKRNYTKTEHNLSFDNGIFSAAQVRDIQLRLVSWNRWWHFLHNGSKYCTAMNQLPKLHSSISSTAQIMLIPSWFCHQSNRTNIGIEIEYNIKTDFK